MFIPVSHLMKGSDKIGTLAFDTERLEFIKSDKISDRNLPLYFSKDSIKNNENIGTIIGKTINDCFIVSFGSDFCYEMSRFHIMRKCNISNINIDCFNKVVSSDDIPNVKKLFPDRKIKLASGVYSSFLSTKGKSRKFQILYHIDKVNKMSILKVPEDVDSVTREIKYKKIADELGIPCCKVFDTVYFGRRAVVSIFDYSLDDTLVPFNSISDNIEDALLELEDEDSVIFDRYMVLDYILAQNGRKLSSYAYVNGRLYPLFNNKCCLGLDGKEEASRDIVDYVDNLELEYKRELLGNYENIFKYLEPDEEKLVRKNIKKLLS